jgi:hypothetical protein
MTTSVAVSFLLGTVSKTNSKRYTKPFKLQCNVYILSTIYKCGRGPNALETHLLSQLWPLQSNKFSTSVFRSVTAASYQVPSLFRNGEHVPVGCCIRILRELRNELVLTDQVGYTPAKQCSSTHYKLITRIKREIQNHCVVDTVYIRKTFGKDVRIFNLNICVVVKYTVFSICRQSSGRVDRYRCQYLF